MTEYDPLTTLRSLQGAASMRSARSEEELRQMQIADAKRQMTEGAAMRQAAAGAVVPQTATAPAGQMNVGGASIPYGGQQVQGPPTLDRAKLYGNIAANPNIAYQLPGVQAQDAKGQLDHQTAMVQLQEVVGKLQKQGDEHSKAVLEQMNTSADQMGRMAMAVKNAPPEMKAQIYQQVLQQAAQNPVLAPRVQQLPQQYDPSMEPMLDSVIAQATDVKSALAKAGETVQLGSGPQGPGVYTKNPLQPNVPGAKLGDLPKTVAPAVRVSVGGSDAHEAARNDKSYQFSSGQLDKVGQPVEAAVQRMGRLKDTIAQGTPQADALVAPELLTVMAGGAGSGLRMNEAEISRIVGGRSKWESLQASINQWKLDPSKANSITEDQRQQIHALVNTVNDKLIAKQQLMDDARNKLIDAKSPEEHRRIVAQTRQALTQIDMSSGGGSQQAGAPKGATHTGVGSADKKVHWLDAQGNDLGVKQ